MSDFTIKSGATSPDLVVTLLDGGTPQDLTGASVTMRMRPVSGGPLTLEAPAAVVAPTESGVVSYTWVDDDTATPGEYEVEWVVTFANGTEQPFPGTGYTTVTIEPSLTSEPANPIPDLPDECWPVDQGCCDDFDNYSPAVQARSKALAVSALRSLTGYQVGGCPVVLRPCKDNCLPGYSGWASGPPYVPYINGDGQWLNMVCGNCVGDCSCATLEQISLPLPVGRVDGVKVGGVALQPSAYRLDSPGWLVRVDGGSWPTCQDLTLDDDQPGTMSVTYLNAEVVDGLASYAAGVLACEFAKACAGAKCRLPSGVTEISRRGLTMTIPAGLFTEGLTGIREVDVFILSHNPYLQKTPSTVWSPDQRTQRTMLR